MGNVNCRRWNKTATNYSFPWFLLFFVSVSECIFIPRQCARGQLRMQQGHWTRHTFEGDSPHRGAPCATSLIFCGFSLGAFHRLQLTLLKRTELSWHVPNVFFSQQKKLNTFFDPKLQPRILYVVMRDADILLFVGWAGLFELYLQIASGVISEMYLQLTSGVPLLRGKKKVHWEHAS